MGVFDDVLTTEGQRFLMKMLSGETQNIKITKLVLGDGNTSADLKTITPPVHAVAEVEIDSVLLSTQNDVTITAVFRNTDIAEGFYMREKAIYATDGTNEVLVLYANAGSLAEYIEPSTSEVYEKILRSVLIFSQSDNVNITVDDAGYTTIIDFNSHTEKAASSTELGHIKIGAGLQMNETGSASVKLVNDLKTDDSQSALTAAMDKELDVKKTEIYISESIPDTRKENTLYFKVTDTISYTSNDTIVVSPILKVKREGGTLINATIIIFNILIKI